MKKNFVKHRIKLSFEFVEFIPNDIQEGKLYISMQYATAVHKCCCGCGEEVVTPFSPTDWKFIFDGESASLNPSIGNWNFKCQSHYWIKRNEVMWAKKWSKGQIKQGRENDRLLQNRWYAQKDKKKTSGNKTSKNIWSRVRDFLSF